MGSYARNEILGYLNNVKRDAMAIITLNDRLNFAGFYQRRSPVAGGCPNQITPGISSTLVAKSEIGGEQELESFLSANGPRAWRRTHSQCGRRQ